MFNVSDLIVIIIIGLTALVGYKKGFIKTAFGFASFFVALILTIILYKPVMGIIKENTGFEAILTEYLYELDSKSENTQALELESGEIIEVSNEEKSYFENLPDTVMDFIGIDEIKENAKNTIIQKIVDFVLKLLSIVIVYITIRLILFILVLVLDLIAKLPVLKQFNEIMGLIIGIVLGFIRVYAILAVVTLVGSIPATSGITVMINNSLIASFLYNNNLLLKILF